MIFREAIRPKVLWEKDKKVLIQANIFEKDSGKYMDIGKEIFNLVFNF